MEKQSCITTKNLSSQNQVTQNRASNKQASNGDASQNQAQKNRRIQNTDMAVFQHFPTKKRLFLHSLRVSALVRLVVIAQAASSHKRSLPDMLHEMADIKIYNHIANNVGTFDTYDDLIVAARYHDIGKQTLPVVIINKPGQLTTDEWDLMLLHPEAGYNALCPKASNNASHGVLHHHERWDGGGYPAGLVGTNIPLISRIIAIADTFEAMVTARPYAAAVSVEGALTEIDACAGTQFDPVIVSNFINFCREANSFPLGCCYSSVVG